MLRSRLHGCVTSVAPWAALLVATLLLTPVASLADEAVAVEAAEGATGAEEAAPAEDAAPADEAPANEAPANEDAAPADEAVPADDIDDAEVLIAAEPVDEFVAEAAEEAVEFAAVEADLPAEDADGLMDLVTEEDADSAQFEMMYEGGKSVTVYYRQDAGTVTVSPENPEQGQTVTVTVKPNNGWCVLSGGISIYTGDTENNPMVTFDQNGSKAYTTEQKLTFTKGSAQASVNVTFMYAGTLTVTLTNGTAAQDKKYTSDSNKDLFVISQGAYQFKIPSDGPKPAGFDPNGKKVVAYKPQGAPDTAKVYVGDFYGLYGISPENPNVTLEAIATDPPTFTVSKYVIPWGGVSVDDPSTPRLTITPWVVVDGKEEEVTNTKAIPAGTHVILRVTKSEGIFATIEGVTLVEMGPQSRTLTATKKNNTTYEFDMPAWNVVSNSYRCEIDYNYLTPKITTKPTARELTCNGQPQALVNAGAAEGGVMMYSLGEEDRYSEEIPTATDAGTYKVYYMVSGDRTKNYRDLWSEDYVVSVTIAPAPAPEPAPAPVVPTIAAVKKAGKATLTAAPGTVFQLDLGGVAGKKFKSSNKKVARVDSNGLVTMKKAGKATISFKVGKKTRKVKLTFKDSTIPAYVAINSPASTAVKKGDTVTLTPVVPDGTNPGSFKWKSSNRKVATVKNGVVTFKKGSKKPVTITCTAKRGGKKAKVKFTVSK